MVCRVENRRAGGKGRRKGTRKRAANRLVRIRRGSALTMATDADADADGKAARKSKEWDPAVGKGGLMCAGRVRLEAASNRWC